MPSLGQHSAFQLYCTFAFEFALYRLYNVTSLIFEPEKSYWVWVLEMFDFPGFFSMHPGSNFSSNHRLKQAIFLLLLEFGWIEME